MTAFVSKRWRRGAILRRRLDGVEVVCIVSSTPSSRRSARDIVASTAWESRTWTTMVSASHPDHLYPFQNGEYSLFDVLGADEEEYRANVKALDFHKADYKFY